MANKKYDKLLKEVVASIKAEQALAEKHGIAFDAGKMFRELMKSVGNKT